MLMADPKAFFVYGTLRPDDPSGAPWTKPFNQGMKSFPARLFGHRLYKEQYPLVMSPDAGAKATDCVVGDLVFPISEYDWQEKLAQADSIEGCPDFYQRKIVSVTRLLDNSTTRAWLYYRTAPVDAENIKHIPSGDWTKQKEVN